MKHAFSIIRPLLMKLLAYVMWYACRGIIRMYDSNKDGILRPEEVKPFIKVVNIINKYGFKEK